MLFFSELDKAVNQAGVRNGAYFRVSGFPYLRANRFVVSLKGRLGNDAQRNRWVHWMQQLDMAARKAEIQNLPAAKVQKLAADFGFEADRQMLLASTIEYSNKLLAHDQNQPDFFEVLGVAVQDASEYSTLMRVFGLYPLAAVPVAIVTLQVNEEIAEWHQMPEDERPTLGRLTIYGPAEAFDFNRLVVRTIMERSRQNPLEIPLPSADDRKTLQAIFAPLIVQDLAADYDRLGAVVWTDKMLGVNPDTPTAYTYFSNAYLNRKPILQINYVFWYSERNGPNSPRIERGNLDGLTVRVSLDERGSPFMVDIMNNCGCYHFYVPRKERVARILPVPMAIDAFVPARLPENYPRQRIAILVISGWHQVSRISSRNMPTAFEPYQLVPYEQLEMLPQNGDLHASMFNSRGISKHSERVESDIFIPMGVPQVGRMRQRGHHAVKFVGRAHFDDPYLFDRHFDFKSIPEPSN
ncbi:MAG: hypothetical protein PVF09_02345 [Desulfobacterales bacterium]